MAYKMKIKPKEKKIAYKVVTRKKYKYKPSYVLLYPLEWLVESGDKIKTFKTKGGAERFIKREKGKGRLLIRYKKED
jgi:hypothetical protein